MSTTNSNKRIDPNAYNALAEALAVIYWNKQPLERYLRSMLRDIPELLYGLDFSEPKREIAGKLVERLMANEAKYQSASISLMLNISQMESFPNLEGQEDRDQKISIAKRAVAELKKWTQRHQAIIDENEKYTAEIIEASEKANRNRVLSSHIGKLREQFMAMFSSTNPQERGREFEGFINNLFGLFDMEPRAAYSLEREQIDGAFSFDTDDFVLEAKWWKDPIGRDNLDVFKAKVERKGRNALGLFISVNGFTQDALKEYSHSTPFITMDGGDLFAVLEERVRLDELLRRKKRYMNETGDCYFPASKMFH